jgi:hypothetical protein
MPARQRFSREDPVELFFAIYLVAERRFRVHSAAMIRESIRTGVKNAASSLSQVGKGALKKGR